MAKNNPSSLGTFTVTHANPTKKRSVADRIAGQRVPFGTFTPWELHEIEREAGEAADWELLRRLARWKKRTKRNPTSKKTQAKIDKLHDAGRYDDAYSTYIRSHRAMRGAMKRNPVYKAGFSSAADRAAVRKALRSAGFEDVKVREAVRGKKRAPGPYAQFVKAQMPALVKSGMSAGEAMKAIGGLWRARKSRGAGNR